MGKGKDKYEKQTESRPFHLYKKRIYLLLFLIFSSLAFGLSIESAAAQEDDLFAYQYVLSGVILDTQEQKISEVEVLLFEPGHEQPVDEVVSQADGSWIMRLAEVPASGSRLTFIRQHYSEEQIRLTDKDLSALKISKSQDLGAIVMSRKITPSFWAVAAIFTLMLVAIATNTLHSTTAALAALSAVLIVSAVIGHFFPGFYIYSFEDALSYINWEVIFLVMAMMIIIAIIEHTGIFQWTTFQAYRVSRGKVWLLILILIGITAVASALLDNFTTMLLMTPISLQIGLALGINPLVLIIPEILASNVGGISTLIGTPTNILIGAYAKISFTDFLIYQTPGVVVALIALALYTLFHYRKEITIQAGGISPKLYAVLEENARIEDRDALIKSGFVFVLVLVGFVIGEQFEIPPAVPAIIGATALIIWLRPDIQTSIKAVDWTTLVFFMALFVVVGALIEVGVISLIADQMAQLIGENLILGIFVMVFGVGTFSVVIANVPLAASMLPVVEFLSGNIPGASNKVLYYALSMGAAMGGNGFVISGEANLVTAGITEQAGSRIGFAEFAKIGLPVTYITLTIGFVWLVLRFIVIGA